MACVWHYVNSSLEIGCIREANARLADVHNYGWLSFLGKIGHCTPASYTQRKDWKLHITSSKDVGLSVA